MSTDLALRRAVRTSHGSQCYRLNTARLACWPCIAHISITAHPCTWTFSPTTVPSAGFRGSTWSWAALEAHSTCGPALNCFRISKRCVVQGREPMVVSFLFVKI